ncbi:MAG: hypothetical protein CV087_09940 [Candidatus Brocadia sp. WS118]|nr:MAG: hypothetical protein CV087_09940 [Candidatus Brocadia sp. WS118]
MADKIKKMIPTLIISLLIISLLVVTMLLWMCVSYHREKNRRENAVSNAQLLANKIKLGVDVEQSRNQLIEIVDGKDAFAAVSAIMALGEIKDNSNETLDCILRAIRRKEVFALDREAARALSKIKPERADIIDELIHQLDNEPRDVSWFSAEALGEIGTAAKKALPKLNEKLSSNDHLLKKSCEMAIQKILQGEGGSPSQETEQ